MQYSDIAIFNIAILARPHHTRLRPEMPSSTVLKLEGVAAVAVLVGAVAAGAGIVHLLHARSPRPQRNKRASHPKVTVLVVHLAFASPEDLALWLRWWTPLAHTVCVRGYARACVWVRVRACVWVGARACTSN